MSGRAPPRARDRADDGLRAASPGFRGSPGVAHPSIVSRSVSPARFTTTSTLASFLSSSSRAAGVQVISFSDFAGRRTMRSTRRPDPSSAETRADPMRPEEPVTATVVDILEYARDGPDCHL